MELVTTNDRLRCEVHGCNNPSYYAIGLPNFPQTHFLVCTECMEKIWEAQRIFNPPEQEDDQEQENEDNKESTDNKENEGTDNSEQTEEDKNKEIHERLNKIAQDFTNKDEQDSEPDENVYVCQKCGKTFKKPDELNEYKGHRMRCKGDEGEAD